MGKNKCYEFKGEVFESKKDLYRFMKIDYIKNGPANVAPREIEIGSDLDSRFPRSLPSSTHEEVAVFPDGDIVVSETSNPNELNETVKLGKDDLIPESDNLSASEVFGDTDLQTETTEGTETIENEKGYYEGDITPESDTIFVFGSNPEGKHGKGAAEVAKKQFGAKQNQGEGLQGNAYALPTKDLSKSKEMGIYSKTQIDKFMKEKVIPYYKENSFTDVITNNPFERSISPQEIMSSIESLYAEAESNPDKKFKVAYREGLFGYSLNGYLHGELIEMFNAVGDIPSNVIFSKEWFDTGNLNILQPETTEEIPQKETTETKPSLGRYELFPGVFANEEQRDAIDKMENFLSSKEKKPLRMNNKADIFMLKGRGGTGKTTIIKKVVESIKSKDPMVSIGYVAPTHKAKEVLSKSVGEGAMTLASGLSVDLDKRTGKFKPNKWKRKQFGVPLQRFSIIIIDEGSMIADSNLDDLLNEISANTKVIIMGDNAQLPPVGQGADSKVFEHEGSELKTRMRQGEESPIVPLTDVVAENVESEKPIIRAIKDRTGDFNITENKGVLFLEKEAHFLHYFEKDYKENPESTKVITYNNENHKKSSFSVLNMNPKIREKIFGEKAKQELIEGEQLMAYDTLQSPNEGDIEPIIQNAVDYTVVKIHEKVLSFNVKVSTDPKYGAVQTIDLPLSGYIVDLKNNITGKVDPKNKKMFIPDNKTKALIKNTANNFFEEKNYTLGYAVKDAVPNLHYGYAITTHKAQGSTYRNAYVIEDNILGKSNASSIKEKNQALYVAVSRPSQKLVMLSRLNDITKINAYKREEISEDDERSVPSHVEKVKEQKKEEEKEKQKESAESVILKAKDENGEPLVKKDCSFAAFRSMNKRADI